MSKARGKKEVLDLVQVSGLDSRVWQKDGSSTNNLGVVFSLAGEVVKTRGIQPLIDWAISLLKGKRPENPVAETGIVQPSADPLPSNVSPFYDPVGGLLYDLMSIGTFNMNGAVEILLEYGGNLSVVRGCDVEVLQSGRHVAKDPSEGTQFLQVGGAVLILNGRDPNMKWDGLKLTPLGISSPPSAPILRGYEDGSHAGAVSAAASTWFWPGSTITKVADSLTQSYEYKLSFVNDQGAESEPSAVSNKVTDVNQAPSGTTTMAIWVKVGGLSQNPDRNDIVSRRLYRAGFEGLQYYLLAELPGLISDVYMDSTSNTYTSSVSTTATGTRLPPPLSKMAMFFRGTTYYAGNPKAPRNLYASAGGGLKEEVPQPGNVTIVNTDDGSDEIVAMAVVSDYGLVFTKRSLHMLTQDKTGGTMLTPISQTIGAVSTRGVAAFEDKIYFFSEEGIFLFEGGSPQPLSKEISSLVKGLPRARLKNVVAFVDPSGRRVCFSVCAGPENRNNEVWSVHVDTGAVSRLPFSVFDSVRYKGETLVSFSHSQTGNLFSVWAGDPPNSGSGIIAKNAQFKVTELGVWGCLDNIAGVDSIEGFFETRWVVGDNPESDKTYYRADVFYVQTADIDMTVSWFTDWSRDSVGSQTFKLCDPEALVWGESGVAIESVPASASFSAVTAGELTPVTWGNVVPVEHPKPWDERRIRSKRIALNAGDSLLQNRLTDHSGEELSGKSIKIRFEAISQRGDPLLDKPWRIVGLILYYADHGVRAEGPDLPKDV
jgi:hypothetical protein